jgi:hypothetical protein
VVARDADFGIVDGQRIPSRAEAAWIVDGVEFIYVAGLHPGRCGVVGLAAPCA